MSLQGAGEEVGDSAAAEVEEQRLPYESGSSVPDQSSATSLEADVQPKLSTYDSS